MRKMEKEVGDIFKTKREELGLSLKEVESSTSIRSNYLDAIERGTASEIISSVYMYGFMKQYASYLDLDSERLSRDYPDLFRFPMHNNDFSSGVGTLEPLNSSSSKGDWLPKVLWGVSFVAVFIGCLDVC